MKCCSMRTSFDRFLKLLNSEMFCFCHNCIFVFLFLIHRHGFPVPVWSFSTCLGVNTQRFVDSCPDTGFPVLVEFVTSSCFSWFRVSRSNLVRSRDYFLHLLKGFSVLDNWYWVLVRFVGCRCCFLQYQNRNRTSNYLCRKLSSVVEVTHTLSGIWLLQISSQSPSGYNKLGVYRTRWLRSILFDRTSILSVEQVVYRPLLLVRCKTWFGQIKLLRMGFTAVKNTVCLSLLEFCPPAIHREFVMECKLTAHPIW